MKLKMFMLLITTLILGGCAFAVFQTYDPVEVGPRSKLIFISNNLKGEFLADVDLDLIIYEANSSCRKVPKGRLELEPKINKVSTYIPAGEYTYLRVEYFKNSFLGYSSSGGERFAFKPEDGKEYTIEYDDRKLNFSLSLYEGTIDARGEDVDVIGWDECQKIKET